MTQRPIASAVTRPTFRIAGVLFTFLLVYLAWYWWDMRQLRAFCADIHVGTPVAQVQQIADRHGISKRWLNGDGAFNDKTGQWSFYVPSAASVGANVFAIHHDKLTVVSAIVEID